MPAFPRELGAIVVERAEDAELGALDERVTRTAATIAPSIATVIAPAASRRRLRGPIATRRLSSTLS